MSKKNLLVTGGAGFIGSCFVLNQIRLGNNIIVCDNLTYAGHEVNLKEANGNYKFINQNIDDKESIYNILKRENIDNIINFAAESHVDNSISDPSIFIKTNIVGTYQLLSASLKYYNDLDQNKKSSFRYLQISTDEIYGSLGDYGKFDETSCIAPNSPYSASKAAGDLLVRSWFKTYGLPVLTTNCSNNYGPRQLPEKLIPLVIFSALSGKSIPIYGNGENIRDWIHVEDHINGINLVLKLGKIGETYCLGGDNEISNINLVNNICEILDNISPKSDKSSYKKQIIFVKDRLGHDKRYAIDDSKAVNELGFKRKYNFFDGVKDTINWYINNQDWYKTITEKMNFIKGQ